MASNAYPVGDAEVTDLEFRRWAGPITGNGVIPTTDNAYEVFGDSSGRQVKVRPGYAYIKGILFPLAAQLTVALDAGSGQPRIDAIILKLTASGTPTGDPIVKKGAAAASPVAPALTQTADGTYEILLAHVNVPSASSYVVSAGMVVDKRTMLAPPGRPAFITADGDYLKIAADGVGPRLYTDKPLVYDRTYSTAAPDGNRPVVVTTTGTVGSLTGPLHTDYIPKQLDVDVIRNYSNRSGGVAGTGLFYVVDKVSLSSVPTTTEDPNLYVGSDGVVKKSTAVTGLSQITPTAGSGWSVTVNKLTRQSGTAWLSFNATRATALGSGGGVVINIPAGYRTNVDQWVYGWVGGGAEPLGRVFIDASANTVRIDQALAAGLALAVTLSWPVTS